jgi:hypothetical protein
VKDTAQRRIDAPARHAALGWIALAQNKTMIAVSEFRESDRVPFLVRSCPMCIDAAIGLAFDRGNMPDSAIAAYEHFVRTPYIAKLAADAFDLPWILRRLGALYQVKRQYPEVAFVLSSIRGSLEGRGSGVTAQVAAVRRTIASLEARDAPNINKP